MRALRILPQTTPLRGAIRVPGDKSISHRAVLLAALADGESKINGWLPAGDTRATLATVQALGVAVHTDETAPTHPNGAKQPTAWNLQIIGCGLRGLQAPAAPLDCANAGTCMRLLAGILAGQSFASTLDGSEQLRQRPMARIVTPLRQMGAQISGQEGRAPLTIHPAPLRGIEYRMPVASAQVKSAVLLAGLYADGETTIYQPGPARDHTERMLAAMGIRIEPGGDRVTLAAAEGARTLQPLALSIPGDLSSAAFPLVAATIVPGSAISVEGVGLNKTRTGLLDLLREMGPSVSESGRYETGGEPVGTLEVVAHPLHAVEVAGARVVRAIDELPIWAVAATQAVGTSRLHDAAELRVKEVDRIGRLAGELRRMGAEVEEYADGMAIRGPVQLQGARVDSHGDHRLGMALAVAGLVASGATTVQNAACIADSFPGFVETMQALGTRMTWVDLAPEAQRG